MIGKYEKNKIYLGNNTELSVGLPDECIDLVVTSPPYGEIRDYNGYSWDFEALAKQLFRVTKTGGVVVWVVNDQSKNGDESGESFRQALFFKEIGFKLADTMIYQKKGINGAYPLYYPMFEYMFIFSRGKIKTFNPICDIKNKYAGTKWATRRNKNGKLRPEYMKTNEYSKRGNIWTYDTGRGHTTKDTIAFKHPAIFPEALARDHIISWSNPGDLVFDPFMGSGTTAKVARDHGRDYIGFEISKEYIDIADERLRQKLMF